MKRRKVTFCSLALRMHNQKRKKIDFGALNDKHRDSTIIQNSSFFMYYLSLSSSYSFFYISRFCFVVFCFFLL